MKLINICISVLIASLLIGCIREDNDKCNNTVSLSFEYVGDGQTDILKSKIEKVLLYLFDDKGQFIEKHEINKNSLESYQGIVLSLDQGSYRAVCWGNTFSNTAIIENEKDISGYLLTHPDYMSETPIKTNDSLYYATRSFYVGENNSEDITIPFVSAHIKFEIYIQGLIRQQTTNTAGITPVIEIGNLLTEYTFDMSLYGDSVSFFPDIIYDTSGQIALAKLNVFRFSNDNPIYIIFNYNDNTMPYRLNLREFMESNNIVVEGMEEVTIPIYIKFNNLGVEVSVDKWNNSGVNPIF